MKKKYFILLAFLSVFANAQVNRFYYHYQYIPDSNNKEDVKKEMMILDIQNTTTATTNLFRIPYLKQSWKSKYTPVAEVSV